MKFIGTALALLLIALLARADDPVGTIVLDGKDAHLTGGGIRYQPESNRLCIGFWNGMSNSVSWKFGVPAKKTYRVFVTQSCVDQQAGTEFMVSVAGQQANGIVKGTGEWAKFSELDLGPVMIRKPGQCELVVRPVKVTHNTVMNLRAIKLVPED